MTFTEKFCGYGAGETIECEVDGFTVTATLHRDDDATPPWEREDGHGIVSDWRRAGMMYGYAHKAPGERPLCTDHGSTRFYDFAQACKTARTDGWGYAPEPMTVLQNSGGKWHAFFGNGHAQGCNVGGFDDQNEAIVALYASHRATMTPRAYAAAAAFSDYEHLRKWCDDQWHYVGVAVTVERNGVKLTGDYDHAVWGIESDAGDYLTETANENLDDAIAAAREKIAKLSA